MLRGFSSYRFITDHLGSVRLVVNTNDGSVAPEGNSRNRSVAAERVEAATISRPSLIEAIDWILVPADSPVAEKVPSMLPSEFNPANEFVRVDPTWLKDPQVAACVMEALFTGERQW